MSLKFPDHCGVIKNKYYLWYEKLIIKTLNRKSINGYYEKHHIIPRCLNSNTHDIVRLTAREHFVAHLLLPKFICDPYFQKKLIFALFGICNQKNSDQKRHVVNSRTYEKIKLDFIQRISGDNHWMKDPDIRKKVSDSHKGLKMDQKTKDKISFAHTGRKMTLKWKEKIGNANKNKKRTKEMNEAQSVRIKKEYQEGKRISPTQGMTRERHVCEICGEKIDIANLKKWHGLDKNCLDRKNRKELKSHRNTKPSPTRTEYCKNCDKFFGKYFFKKIHKNRCNTQSS